MNIPHRDMTGLTSYFQLCNDDIYVMEAFNNLWLNLRFALLDGAISQLLIGKNVAGLVIDPRSEPSNLALLNVHNNKLSLNLSLSPQASISLKLIMEGFFFSRWRVQGLKLVSIQRKSNQNSHLQMKHLYHSPSPKSSGFIMEEGTERLLGAEWVTICS